MPDALICQVFYAIESFVSRFKRSGKVDRKYEWVTLSRLWTGLFSALQRHLSAPALHIAQKYKPKNVQNINIDILEKEHYNKHTIKRFSKHKKWEKRRIYGEKSAYLWKLEHGSDH